jgi:serine/threonine-protein kinase
MSEAPGTKSAEPRPSDPAEASLPQVFGRYLLLRRLSRGGMGEIFLAKLGEIQGFEKLVIIKKVLPNLAADGEFIKRFIDEAQVAIKLNHANIAPVFEVGRVDGEYFLAIAYVEGRDLRRMMSRLRERGKKLPPELALLVVRELAAGLAYAHRRTDDENKPLNLVHCDVSPPNVMVSFEGEVKIIDFGIAKSAIRLAQSNPNMGFGKFGYMAPEQLLRGGVIDKRTDLYAAGVVLYELLTGERMVPQPEGGDYRAVARAVTQGKFPPPSSKNPAIPSELDTLVMKAMAVKVDDRFQTGEALRDAIQTELARVAPTISGDQLAAVLRELFDDELSEERELLARMSEVDLAPFREELTEAGQAHTVTFARAMAETSSPSLHAARPAPPTVESSRPPSSRPPTAETDPLLEAETRESQKIPLPEPDAARRIVWLGALAMLLGACMVWFLFRPTRPVAVVAPPPPPVPVVTPLPTPTPTPTPVVTPLATPTPAPVVTPLPVPRPTATVVKHDKHGKHERRLPPPPPPTANADAVQAKFRKVRGEYTAFKSQYGGVLEERWNAIATEITFGKPGNDRAKYERVDALLDALRKQMQKVRDGS